MLGAMGVGRSVRIFSELLRHAIALYTLYRVHIWVWMLTGTLPLVVMFVWLQIGKSLPPDVLSHNFVVIYFATVFLVRQATPMWVATDLEDEIGRDELAVRLLVPVGPIWTHAARHIAGAGLRMPPTLAIWAAIVFLGGAAASVAWERVPLFLLTLAAAWGILFALMVGLGALAFWSGRVQALVDLLGGVMVLLGGAVVPLDFLPTWAKAIAAFTPFPSVIAFPASILLKDFGWEVIIKGATIQAAWLIALSATAALLWSRGKARHIRLGAT